MWKNGRKNWRLMKEQKPAFSQQDVGGVGGVGGG